MKFWNILLLRNLYLQAYESILTIDGRSVHDHPSVVVYLKGQSRLEEAH